MTKYEVRIPKGTTPEGLGHLIADLVQHHRVRSLEISPRGEISVEVALREGEAATPSEFSSESTPIDLCRHVPVEEPLVDPASPLLSLLRLCSKEEYLPLGWVAAKLPEHAAAAVQNPLRIDFWLAGHRGYFDSEAPEGTLLLFAGWEVEGGLRAVKKVYRLQEAGRG